MIVRIVEMPPRMTVATVVPLLGLSCPASEPTRTVPAYAARLVYVNQ